MKIQTKGFSPLKLNRRNANHNVPSSLEDEVSLHQKFQHSVTIEHDIFKVNEGIKYKETKLN